jgi:hypothetical protein
MSALTNWDDDDVPTMPMKTMTPPQEVPPMREGPLPPPIVDWSDVEADRDAQLEAFALQKLKQKNCTKNHDDYCAACGYRKLMPTLKTKYTDFYSQY